MKKSLVRMISLLIALFGMCFAVRDAGALDAPHNTNDKTWSITCSLCHYNPSSTPGWATYPTATDNTFINNLCKSSHINTGKMAGSAPEYQDALTHSSYLTSTQYGVWTHDCSICHNPHYQQQATNSGTDPMNYVVTGTISALSTAPGATVTSLGDSTKDFITLAASFGLSDPYYFSGYLWADVGSVHAAVRGPGRLPRVSGLTVRAEAADLAGNTASVSQRIRYEALPRLRR